MEITIDPIELDPFVRDGAVLVGLLKEQDDQSLAFNEGWFEHPAEHIRQVPRSSKPLLNLLAGILGPEEPDIPKNGDKRRPINTDGDAWHPISTDDGPTGLYAILPTDRGASPAHTGIGLWNQTRQDGISITPSVRLPLFALTPEKDPRFLLGEPGMPLELAMAVDTTKKPFEAGGSTFNSLHIEAKIYFDGTAPTLAVSFLDSEGHPVKALQSLRELLSAAHTGWRRGYRSGLLRSSIPTCWPSSNSARNFESLSWASRPSNCHKRVAPTPMPS